MSSDTSFLNTGVVKTARSKRPDAKVDERQEEKKKKANSLRPSLVVIKEWIEEERSLVCDIRTFITSSSTPKEQVDKELYARAKQMEFLNRIERKLEQTMKAGE